MYASVRQFIKICTEELPIIGTVYEFGSYQVNGQRELADLRPLFKNVKFIGSDIRDGPGVDIIFDVQDIQLPNECADAVICCEVLEHIKNPQKAAQELHRILKIGGVAILSAPMHYHIHEEPNDYWRFTPFGMGHLLNIFQSKYVAVKGSDYDPYHIIGVGIKGNFDFSRLKSRENEWKHIVDEMAGYKLFRSVVRTKKGIERIILGGSR